MAPASPPAASGPPPTRWRGDAELAGFIATPFEGAGGSVGLGWSILLAIGWERLPIMLGLDVQSAYYDEATSRTSVATGKNELLVDRTRRDMAYFFDGMVRLAPPFWSVRPYAEAIFGAKLLETKYSVALVGGTGQTDTTSEHDWTYTVGVGTGVDLPVLGPRAFLTLGVRFLPGGHARYSRSLSSRSDAVVHYDTSTTTTLFCIGITGRFTETRGAASE